MKSPSASKTQFGAQIESQALAWWLNRDPESRLLDRNFRCKMGEIDLVIQEGLEIVFVEVRARGDGSWVDGVTSVTWIKRQRIERAAAVWLSKHATYVRWLERQAGSGLRFDILAWDGREFSQLRGAWG